MIHMEMEPKISDTATLPCQRGTEKEITVPRFLPNRFHAKMMACDDPILVCLRFRLRNRFQGP